MRTFLAISGWLVAAAALYLARESLRLAVESSAEARESQLIACQSLRTQARLLGWEVDDACTMRWPALTDPPTPR